MAEIINPLGRDERQEARGKRVFQDW